MKAISFLPTHDQLVWMVFLNWRRCYIYQMHQRQVPFYVLLSSLLREPQFPWWRPTLGSRRPLHAGQLDHWLRSGRRGTLSGTKICWKWKDKKIRSFIPRTERNSIERDLWLMHSWLAADARDVGAPHGNLLRATMDTLRWRRERNTTKMERHRKKT